MCAEDVSIDICREIINVQEPKDKDMLLSFDSVLSLLPYKDILDNIFGNSSMTLKDLPVITRAYEESFMREPLNRNERACAMGSACECMRIDVQNQFIGVEFQLPMEETIGPHLCVLCSRKMTQKLFFDLMYGRGSTNTGHIQRYGVMMNVNDEYKVDYCLVMPPQGAVHCMPYPSVVHCRNNYTVVTRACVRYLVQKQDMIFRMPLS